MLIVQVHVHVKPDRSQARMASSMKANPVELTVEELIGILRAAL